MSRYPAAFSETLFDIMKQISPGLKELERYEFQYCLDNLTPANGWESVITDSQKEIEFTVNNREFYDSIQINHKVNGRIELDDPIIRLAQMLFAGLVSGNYPVSWVKKHFYFDVRGFFFLHRTEYFTETVLDHFSGQPFKHFEKKQQRFERKQAIGYKEFKKANLEVDTLFIEIVQKLITLKSRPVLLAIAGPTAAGKTEIVERMNSALAQGGIQSTPIELDNFLTDRDYREAHGIHTQGKRALHFDLLQQALHQITQGKRIAIPRYDFVYATSSHDLDGKLKPGGVPVEIEPADVIFIEGNFPFLLEEIAPLMGIKVVYLTDDAVRLKRKWKRDIDYRKKYDLNYFRNRFFREQFLMAQQCFLPQMEVCDILVDTTGARLWVTPGMVELLRHA